MDRDSGCASVRVESRPSSHVPAMAAAGRPPRVVDSPLSEAPGPPPSKSPVKLRCAAGAAGSQAKPSESATCRQNYRLRGARARVTVTVRVAGGPGRADESQLWSQSPSRRRVTVHAVAPPGRRGRFLSPSPSFTVVGLNLNFCRARHGDPRLGSGWLAGGRRLGHGLRAG